LNQEAEDQEIKMPFTGIEAETLTNVLNFLASSDMATELFDAFLFDYSRCKNLDEALSFARREWDC
jgi:ribosome biogenesis GTPase A